MAARETDLQPNPSLRYHAAKFRQFDQSHTSLKIIGAYDFILA